MYFVKFTRDGLRYQVLCSDLILMSLHFLDFPSLMVHFNLCSFNAILYKSLDENILDHVGIRAVIFHFNC
jgi:hypothetical protein